MTPSVRETCVCGTVHEGDSWSVLAFRRAHGTCEPFLLLMNDDATVTPLTRCHDCGYLFRDIEKHVAESVTVPAIASWVCPPCRRGEHVDTYHLVGVEGARGVCECRVCDA